MNYVDVCRFRSSNINKQLIEEREGEQERERRKIEYSSFEDEEKHFVGTNRMEFFFPLFLVN